MIYFSRGVTIMRNMIYAIMISALILSGCAPAVIGGGAAGAYKVGTDERTMGTMVDDSTVSLRVKNGLISASDVKARNIDVDVLNGVVTLTGLVDSTAEIKRAEEIAFSVEGVKGVTNLLTVGNRSMGQIVDDKLIVGKINSSLLAEPNMRTFNIDVDVNNGIVTLTGIIGTEELKNRAIDIARKTKGVVEVIDNLKVVNQ
jgi:hyperosmotically inducible protein